jgi:DNA-cytosine methyltransferase
MGNKTAIGLFSGIGGFEVGLAALGTSTSLMCESDPTAQAVLRDRFPNIKLVGDIADLAVLPECSILVGGWPCQDLSQAGRMAGIEGLQSGLVSHVFRLLDVSDTMPGVVLLENVAFALNLKEGEAIRHVTSELAARGYRWAYRVLDSREFGLPHRRRRIFICGMREGDPAAALFDGLDQSPQPTTIGRSARGRRRRGAYAWRASASLARPTCLSAPPRDFSGAICEADCARTWRSRPRLRGTVSSTPSQPSSARSRRSRRTSATSSEARTSGRDLANVAI